MIKISVLTSALLVTLMLQGCATKTYGRFGNVTNFEQTSLSCREIDLELAKVNGFIQQVNSESEFDGRSVLSFLGDFGIGNVMEKDSALKSANARAATLQDLRANRCGNVATVGSSSLPAQTAASSAADPVAPPALRGELAFEVDKLAKKTSCQPSGATTLIAKSTGTETYQVSCQDGNQALYKCELRQCRMLN
jgi:hypothetical protein